MTRKGDLLHFGQIFETFEKQLICPNILPFLGNFCKGGKIFHFSSEIIFGQLLLKFGDFYLVTLHVAYLPSTFYFVDSSIFYTQDTKGLERGTGMGPV